MSAAESTPGAGGESPSASGDTTLEQLDAFEQSPDLSDRLAAVLERLAGEPTGEPGTYPPGQHPIIDADSSVFGDDGPPEPQTWPEPDAKPAARSSAARRKGKRGHDERGNVRPGDDRYDLHKPEDESKVSAAGSAVGTEDTP